MDETREPGSDDAFRLCRLSRRGARLLTIGRQNDTPRAPKQVETRLRDDGFDWRQITVAAPAS